MSQQSFLARCKSLHEIWQCVSNGYLKSLLGKAGCPKPAINNFASLKPLQTLLNIVEKLNDNEESIDAFCTNVEPEGWKNRNAAMPPLFLNNDLRIADAHESIAACLETLQDLGFDTANVNEGYGKALDFVMDGVVGAFGTINAPLSSLLAGARPFGGQKTAAR